MSSTWQVILRIHVICFVAGLPSISIHLSSNVISSYFLFSSERTFLIVPTRSSPQVHSGSLPKYGLERADFDVIETPYQGKSNSIGDAGLFGPAGS